MKLPFSSKCRLQQAPKLQRSGTLGELLDGRNDSYMRSNALDIDEVIFCVLDSMVDGRAETVTAATNTVLRFARIQQEFTIRSILYFLEVQKTTEGHQHSLLCLLRKCITQAHETIPADLMRDVLIFILKELNFLSTSDVRHSVMVDTLEETAVLCPAFSVEVILAFIAGMRQDSVSLTETLSVYIRVLAHVFDKASHNEYIKGASLIGQIASLYDGSTICGESVELCKIMVSLLGSIARALYSLPRTDRADERQQKTERVGILEALALENPSISRFSSWYNQYRNYVPSVVKPRTMNYETMSMKKFGNLVDGSYTSDPDVVWSARSENEESEVTTERRLVVRSNCLGRQKQLLPYKADVGESTKGFVEVSSTVSLGQASDMSTGAGTIGFPMRPETGSVTIQDVIDPLFGLMVDKALPSMYGNPQHAGTCLDVLSSLSLLSKHVSDDVLSQYGATLLDSMVVRFYQYLTGTPYRQVAAQKQSNVWMALQRESKDSYRNKLVTILSSLGSYGDKASLLPPPPLIMCLSNFCKVLMPRHAHIVLTQMPNICEVLFGLLVGLQSAGQEVLLTLCDSSLVSHSSEEDDMLLNRQVGGTFLDISSSECCKDFLSTIVCACRFFISAIPTRAYFVDFLFNKASGEKETAAALFMLGWSCSHPDICNTLSDRSADNTLRDDFVQNCAFFWRMISFLSTLISKLPREAGSACITRLVLSLINHLSRGNWLTFYSLVGYQASPCYKDGFYGEEAQLIIPAQVHSLLALVFNLKVSYDLEERIAENTNAWEKVNSKFSTKFFRKMYYGKAMAWHDIGLMVSSSISFERFLLPYSGDLMFIYIVNNLLFNCKMDALTSMRSLCRLLKWDATSSLATRCSRAALSRTLVFVLHYLHDPINYFAEAFSAAKLLPHVTLLLFGQKMEFSREIWFKKDYKGYDAYILHYEPGEGYGHVSGMDHIVLHFEKLSGFMHKLSGVTGFADTAFPAIEQLSMIAMHLKPPVNTYTSLLKLGNMQSSSSITMYHTLGILHILAMYGRCSVDLCSALIDLLLGFKGTPSTAAYDSMFTVDASLSAVVEGLPKRAALTLVMREKVRYTMNQLRMFKQFNGETPEDKALQDVRLYYNMSPEEVLQHEILTLRGLVIAQLGMSEAHYRCVLWKVYYSLLTRLPSVGAMFTKFTSPVFGEELKATALTALAYLYASRPNDYADGTHLATSGTTYADAEVSEQMTLLSKITDGNHLLEMYNCCFREDHLDKITNDIQGADTVILKCVVTPMIYFCFQEVSPSVQLCIARSLMLAKRRLKQRKSELPMKFPSIALKRILYFVSNPGLKEFANGQTYDTSILETQYSHLFNRDRWDLDFSNLKAVEAAPLKSATDGRTCTNVSLSYFCATCQLSDSFLTDGDAFTTLHTLLSFGDDIMSNVKLRSTSVDTTWWEYINIEELTVRLMSNCLYNFGWQRLSHILSVVLFLSEGFPKDLITYRVSLLVSFLRLLDLNRFVDRNLDQDEKMGFVDCVLILWAHMIRLETGSALRVSLCEYLKTALGAAEVLTVTSAQEDSSISDDLERIDLLIPKELLMISLLRCMKYLSASTCILNSFTIILQLILQQRYADLDHKHLESILTTILNNFSACFENGTVPYSLKNFVIDLAQTDFGVLCNVVYSPSADYKNRFKLSVAKLITTDASLMLQLMEFLESCILAECQQAAGFNYNASIAAILDFTESIYMTSKREMMQSDEGVSFMLTLSMYFLNMSKEPNNGDTHLVERFKMIIEQVAPKVTELTRAGSKDSTKMHSNVPRKQAHAKQSTARNVTKISAQISRLCRSLIGSSERYKLCFFRFVERIVNRHNYFKPKLLRSCLFMFCMLLKEGALNLYGGFVLCLIQKITLFKELQKYYYKALHYYIQSENSQHMNGYTVRLVNTRFKAFRAQENEPFMSKKPSTVLSVEMCSLKNSVLDRLVISLLDDLSSSLSSDLLYAMERATSSLITYVSTHWGFLIRNFKALMSRLLQNYEALIRNEPRILFSFSKLYLSITKWLDACSANLVTIPIEVQRHIIPPLGLLILHRSVSMRSDGLYRKLIQYLNRIVGSGYTPSSNSTSSFSWIKTVLLRKVAGTTKGKKQLCLCGCNNPSMHQTGEVRFCVCHAFYLLDLFSSCFFDGCWGLELGGSENICEEIERLKKDEHIKRTTKVLFGGALESSPMLNALKDIPSQFSSTPIAINDRSEFFDLNAIYKLYPSMEEEMAVGINHGMKMLTAQSMHTCYPGSGDVLTPQRSVIRPYVEATSPFIAINITNMAQNKDDENQETPEDSNLGEGHQAPSISVLKAKDMMDKDCDSITSLTPVSERSYQEDVDHEKVENGRSLDDHAEKEQVLTVVQQEQEAEENEHQNVTKTSARMDIGIQKTPGSHSLCSTTRTREGTIHDQSKVMKHESRTSRPFTVKLKGKKVCKKRHIKKQSMGSDLNSIPCLDSILSLLNIEDLKFKSNGTIKRVKVLTTEGVGSLQSGETQAEERSVTFFDVSDLETIRATTLYSSPSVYRFMLVQKYLSRERLYPSIMSDKDESCDKNAVECTIPEEVMINAVRGVVAILHMSIIHLSKESEHLRRHINKAWPHCFIELARYNAIVHFEALGRATTKQLCKMLEAYTGRIKRIILESLELLAIARSSSLKEGDEE